MKRRNLITAFGAVSLLSACGLGGSRLNPFNWFGRGTRTTPVAADVAPAADPGRSLIPW